jgi:hypothetical protein
MLTFPHVLTRKVILHLKYKLSKPTFYRKKKLTYL